MCELTAHFASTDEYLHQVQENETWFATKQKVMTYTNPQSKTWKIMQRSSTAVGKCIGSRALHSTGPIILAN